MKPGEVASSAVFGIEKSFSIFSVHIELVGFAFDIIENIENIECRIVNTALVASAELVCGWLVCGQLACEQLAMACACGQLAPGEPELVALMEGELSI
jgi:hypothetical protein